MRKASNQAAKLHNKSFIKFTVYNTEEAGEPRLMCKDDLKLLMCNTDHWYL